MIMGKELKLTTEMLQSLQDALNDSIRPDFKEKKDGKKAHKKNKKGKPSNRGSKRNKPETTV